MKIASVMVTTYILCCIRIATKPCKYFQLNAPFFDAGEGIFSKIAIDRLIPPPWRLAQSYDDGAHASPRQPQRQPQRWPVFVKPEWSQNAIGVQRADNAAELRRIRADIHPKSGAARVRYLLQEGATEANEYEIFSIQHHRDPQRWAVFTVTEACNFNEAHPVNSIYNQNTRYREITDSFSAEQIEQLWALVRRIGSFKISRVSVRADSADDLLGGRFHVIEVNLFAPMPINLLDPRYARTDIFRFIMTSMMRLALATKHRDQSLATRPVFTKSMLYNRRSGLLNFLRARL